MKCQKTFAQCWTSMCWYTVVWKRQAVCVSALRSGRHWVAWEESDSEAWSSHLLPGWGPHDAQHAGLCGVVQRDSSTAWKECKVSLCVRMCVLLSKHWKQVSTKCLCCSGSVARVLLFNATGERDSAAMLKLLVVSTIQLLSADRASEIWIL